jgi:hypothetical protein
MTTISNQVEINDFTKDYVNPIKEVELFICDNIDEIGYSLSLILNCGECIPVDIGNKNIFDTHNFAKKYVAGILNVPLVINIE